MTDVLLIHPPAAKPAEPPLGTAVLLASLRSNGIASGAIDANLEGYLHLLHPERVRAAAGEAPSTAVRRGIAHLPRSLDLLRSPEGAIQPARYRTAVSHLEAALSAYGSDRGRLTLGDFVHPRLSEFSPADLERVAAGDASTLFVDYFRDDLLPRVAAERPRIVALSVNYRHQVLPAFELAGLLKRRLPHTLIVGGGGMFTSWRERLQTLDLRFSPFDRIVFGPGEEPLSRIAAGADSYYLEGRRTEFLPDFGFAPLGSYLSPVPVLPVGLSRGCYWSRCLFCPEASAPTHPFSSLLPADVPRFLEELSRRYGVNHFHLTDNAVPLPVLRALASGTGQFSWHGFTRFETPLCDPEFVRALARGGCRMLQLGLESGSPAVLQRLRKGTDLAAAARILQNLEAAGIAAYVYVLLGTPAEKMEDAEATAAFLERHAGQIGFLNLAIMNLPRDSAMLEEREVFGIAAADLPGEGEPLGLYTPFRGANGWGREEARSFLRKRLLASPAIRAIVNRTPPAFTSNHAFLFPRR